MRPGLESRPKVTHMLFAPSHTRMRTLKMFAVAVTSSASAHVPGVLARVAARRNDSDAAVLSHFATRRRISKAEGGCAIIPARRNEALVAW